MKERRDKVSQELDEVIEELAKHSFKIRSGAMSFTMDKFLALLAGVHEEKTPHIRKNLAKP